MMTGISGKSAKIGVAYVLFKQESNFNGWDATTLLVLSGELKLAIWTERNRVKYDKAKLDGTIHFVFASTWSDNEYRWTLSDCIDKNSQTYGVGGTLHYWRK